MSNEKKSKTRFPSSPDGYPRMPDVPLSQISPIPDSFRLERMKFARTLSRGSKKMVRASQKIAKSSRKASQAPVAATRALVRQTVLPNIWKLYRRRTRRYLRFRLLGMMSMVESLLDDES